MQRIVPGIMAIVLSSDRQQILLHLRSDNGLWSVPGGSAEFGEDVTTLTHREVLEETGITIQIIRAFGIYSSPLNFLFRYPDGNEAHSYVLGVECKKTGGTEAPLSDDSVEVRWFDISALPENLMPMQHDVIRDALAAADFVIR